MSQFVVAPSLTDQVYNAIVDDICSGVFPPGTRLRQEALAEKYNVSRQPVQQSLLLLHSQGFVKETGRRGLEVASMSAEEVDNLYRTRAALDGFAAREATQRARPDELLVGQELLKEGKDALERQSLSGFIASDIAFHQFIAGLSRNRTLDEVSSVVFRSVRRVMGEIILLSGFDVSWQEHVAILEAIGDRDADRAETLARQHADRGRRLVIENANRARPVEGAPDSQG